MDGSTQEQKTSRLRRPVTLGHLLVAVVATLVIGSAVTGVAIAGLSPIFSDVPPSHPFFDEIQWMGSTGVSEGYNDGTYRPNQPVSRAEMSAFMQRLFDVQDDLAASARTTSDTADTSFTPINGASVTVEIPPGTSGYVVARFNAESICYGVVGWCTVRLMIDDNGDGIFQPMDPESGADYAFDSSSVVSASSNAWESASIERFETISRGCTCVVRAEFIAPAGMSFSVDDYALVVETDLLPSDESFGP